MTWVIAVAGFAALFALAAVALPRGRSCGGSCGGCEHACANEDEGAAARH